ncbi:MAG: DUF4386 family protein [Chloroflexi bacterium]|nr:MAG: DUF4386 family protein [Chloroflexota bacterium]
MLKLSINLDVIGLFLAGLINTFLALFVAGVVFGPGTAARQADLLLRATWIVEHTLRWQAGWLFWFAVTLSFSWSYYALGRHLDAKRPWPALAIGLAIVAAAVDIIGVLVNLIVLPDLAQALINTSNGATESLLVIFQSMESLANALTNVTAFGLYSAAGLLLLPAVFATHIYPRWLAWLGVAEWGIALIATTLLVLAPGLATGPLLISFALYAPWVWGSAIWLLRDKRPFPLKEIFVFSREVR